MSSNLLHPYLQRALGLAANRERVGSNREIIKPGDSKRRALGFRGGAAVKDVGEHALKTMVPLYGRYSRAQDQNKNASPVTPESLLSNVGVTAFKRKRLH